MNDRRPHLWAVLPAGNDGLRLASSENDPGVRPALAVRSPLQRDVEAAVTQVAPGRTLVVVARHEEAHARQQLVSWPAVEVLVQPRDLGNGPAILLALAHLVARDPHSVALVIPCRAVCPADRPLLRAAENRSDDVDGAVAVHNGVSRGSVAAFWRLAAERVPWHAAMLMGYAASLGTRREAGLLEAVYQSLTAMDFERTLLNSTARGLPSAARGARVRGGGTEPSAPALATSS